jgi:hypothetical protein
MLSQQFVNEFRGLAKTLEARHKANGTFFDKNAKGALDGLPLRRMSGKDTRRKMGRDTRRKIGRDALHDLDPDTCENIRKLIEETSARTCTRNLLECCTS